jgi:hypothetical protein
MYKPERILSIDLLRGEVQHLPPKCDGIIELFKIVNLPIPSTMPASRPNTAVHLDRQLPVRERKIEPPPTHRVKPIFRLPPAVELAQSVKKYRVLLLFALFHLSDPSESAHMMVIPVTFPRLMISFVPNFLTSATSPGPTVNI